MNFSLVASFHMHVDSGNSVADSVTAIESIIGWIKLELKGGTNGLINGCPICNWANLEFKPNPSKNN